MKNKITLKEFFESKDELAIHCDTEEKANKLLKEFDKLGKKWRSGDSYLDLNTSYALHNDRSCYSNKGQYFSVEYYKGRNYKIYSFEDIIFEDTPKNLIPEIAKMLSVEIEEEFTLKQNKKQYVFDDTNGLMERVSEYVWEEPVDGVLNSLLLGEYTIEKLPKKPQLTDAERTILENLPKKYKWIARDKYDELRVFKGKPFKVDFTMFWGCAVGVSLSLEAFGHLFQFIQWRDEEPYNIEELLKGE